MIETANLVVTPLQPAQLKEYLTGRGITESELPYIRTMIAKLVKADGDTFVYNTFWVGIDKQTQEIVGELCLKGEPVNGETEIGYRSFKRGTMAEMVSAVKTWADANGLVLKAIATNPASEKVLKRNNFVNVIDNIFKSK